jgi:CBS domain-containing protein
MGNHHIAEGPSGALRLRFEQALLDDLGALQQMQRRGMLERGVSRLGFEQELFLVRPTGRPAPVALELLEVLGAGGFTTELGRYNLELNTEPVTLGAGAFVGLEATLREALERAREAARTLGTDLALAGILPSLQLADLTLDNLVPSPRYLELNRTVAALNGGAVRTLIQGRDHLQLVLPHLMLETCNTSIQVHLQVDPDRLAHLYNIAQLVSGPLIAVTANSPLLLQHRLWHETRIPVFEQTVDIRPASDRQRDARPRVHFGDEWIGDDVLEVYRDQVARHRVTLMDEPGESSLAVLARGDVPRLRALGLHNGSLYRWNRLCYGVTDGVPHLRLEHRPLAAGPTILDEVANAATFVGLLLGIEAAFGDVRPHFAFGDAKSNFIAGARYGMDASFRWGRGRAVPADGLWQDTLLPFAADGLRRAGIGEAEARRYLDVITARVATGQTGAQWQLDAWEALAGIPNRIARAEAVTRELMARQWTGVPVHAWSLPEPTAAYRWRASCSTVSELMSTDIYTVQPDDLAEVAAEVMAWRQIHHLPVQDDEGRLVGVVTSADVATTPGESGGCAARTVRDVMRRPLATATPLEPLDEAARRMGAAAVECLPVVLGERLVGMLSLRDLQGDGPPA